MLMNGYPDDSQWSPQSSVLSPQSFIPDGCDDMSLWNLKTRGGKMINHRVAVFCLVVLLFGGAGAASAQGRPDAAALIAAQREAMEPLAYMDGVWRGPAKTTLPSGETRAVTQTERIGPVLGGSG